MREHFAQQVASRLRVNVIVYNEKGTQPNESSQWLCPLLCVEVLVYHFGCANRSRVRKLCSLSDLQRNLA